MSNKTIALGNDIFEGRQLGSTKTLTKISILAVIAYLIMFLEIPVMFFPGFLKIDLSDIPALIGAFAMGPAAGIMIELVKNILHFITKTTTGGVGELANFLVGIALIIPAAIAYRQYQSKKAAVTGMIIGTLVMGIMGGIANYYILLPFYAKIMPMEQIIAWSAAANGAIVDMKTLILYAIIPFNILKGIVVAVITSMLYKKLSPILK
ncbi:ECF transporter S component [Geosporobacter ferrireducens]|uniref:Riboflavin transporter n=1 Tax=Geosporobacter ferrireducens TaxID=1424294 RepID=A0A1D8GGF8_9FIRM|nr:ECF transporter S component [Geosporobacter ferrireducens]AOT70001.1 ECF transporter S component [Geosporobacter ferrireducens]MTI53455.1 ECF transporter S component [Geosporobacter ferrireducens]